MLLVNNILTHVRKISLHLVAYLTLICPGAFLTLSAALETELLCIIGVLIFDLAIFVSIFQVPRIVIALI